jgi:hypothetical protein
VKVYIDASRPLASVGEVAVWGFDLHVWGECAQAPTDELALAAYARRTGETDLEVVERITGETDVFDRDLQPCLPAERERTLEILRAQRALTLGLLGSVSPAQLDVSDESVVQPRWMDWRTPAAIGWHIASTESSGYPKRMGLPVLPPLDDLIAELEASEAHARRLVETVAPDHRHSYRGETWTTVKFLRRLAWHERLELVYLRRRLRALRGFLRLPEGDARPIPPALPVDPSSLTAAQQELARFGEQLFRQLAGAAGQLAADPVTVIPVDDGVAVVRAVRGGGMILVAPDRAVLFQASSVTFDRAVQEFRAGARTPLEKFGAPS